MSHTLKIVGIDPAMSNTGFALAEVDVHTLEWKVIELHLAQTAPSKEGKQVRKSSDDLARGKVLHQAMHDFFASSGATLAVAEVPTGTQSARGSFSNGMCCMLLAGVPVPLIEVNPTEVKLASCGHKYAAKEEIIEWAVGKWPLLPWLRQKRDGAKFKKGDLMADNEHLADACASIAAGLKTPMFQQAVTMMRAALPLAA